MTLNADEAAELQEFRAQAVLQEMRDISEDHWCAGWNTRLEHDLYLIVFEGALADYGMGEIPTERVEALRIMAEKANVWWCWDDAEIKPVSISLDVAKERYSKATVVSGKQVKSAKTVSEIVAMYEMAPNPQDWQLEPLQPIHTWIPSYDGHLYFLLADMDVELSQTCEGDYELRYGYTSIKRVIPDWAPKHQRR